MHILNLIRWKNLSILICSALLIRFALIPGFEIVPEVGIMQYLILLVSILNFTAGGYIINDVFDVTTDSINKPDRLIIDKFITRAKALALYVIFNLIGLGTAFYLFLKLPFQDIGLIFYILIFSPLALASYSIWLKRKAIIGNLLVSCLVGLSLFCLGSILINEERYPVVYFTMGMYTILAFLLNLCRELVKDIEDIRGDYYCQMTTLPILIGRKRTNYIIFGLLIGIILILLTLVLSYFLHWNVLIFYVFSLIILPLILISKQILGAHSDEDYTTISRYIKLIFLTGISSMLTFLVL